MSSIAPPQRQTIHSIHNKQFWMEFFCLYEAQPALWDVNSIQYKNRQLKSQAYDVMVEKLREIEPDSDREDVLRKINIFRTNYRRECARINKSLQEGRPYKSTLWYFDILSFLQPTEGRERKRKLIDDSGEKSIMRKRRQQSTTVLKSGEKYVVRRFKDNIIEYNPQLAVNDFDYDKYDEEKDFDYVVENLSHALADGGGGGGDIDDDEGTTTTKNDSTDIHDALQIHDEPFDQHDLADDEDVDDNSQVDYEQEYQRYSMLDDITSSANSQCSKNDLTSRDITLSNSLICSEERNNKHDTLILTDASALQQHPSVYDEYDESDPNVEVATTGVVDTMKNLNPETQWPIKEHVSEHYKIKSSPKQQQQNITIANDGNDPVVSTSSNEDLNHHRLISQNTKYVRDVKTMTTDAINSSDKNHTISPASEIMAKSWAIQYDELTNEQKILARKAINDILFDACMNQLVLGSNGRVTTSINNNSSSINYGTTKHAKMSSNEMPEVESGNIYEQASSSSTTIAIVSDNTAGDQWLKL